MKYRSAAAFCMKFKKNFFFTLPIWKIWQVLMKLKTDKKIPQREDCYFWKLLYDFPVKAECELLSLLSAKYPFPCFVKRNF